jgi:small neutral amino acid transporter SnatA (MarC family)
MKTQNSIISKLNNASWKELAIWSALAVIGIFILKKLAKVFGVIVKLVAIFAGIILVILAQKYLEGPNGLISHIPASLDDIACKIMVCTCLLVGFVCAATKR